MPFRPFRGRQITILEMGLHIIEDLRWQPTPYERAGFTRTADHFRSYSEARGFTHADPATQAAFAAPAPAVSGCFRFQVRYDKQRKDQVAVIHKRRGAGAGTRCLEKTSDRSFFKTPARGGVGHVPRGFAFSVGSATVGSSGQGWRGYWPRMSFLTSA